MTQPRDVIITGVPRSGTTLTCHLLNKLPDVVALHEPMRPDLLRGLDRSDVVRQIAIFFDLQRRQIRHTGTASSKSSGGSVPDNPLGNKIDAGAKRVSRLDGETIELSKALGDTFTLAIKHPGLFTAMLPELKCLFPCYGIIRNPVASLLSWSTTPFPVANGRMPSAEAFTPGLGAQLDARNDVIDRQIVLIDWMFKCYLDYIPDSILRYEDIIASGGKILSAIAQAAEFLDEPLMSMNRNAMYANECVRNMLATRLIRAGGAYLEFYSEQELLG